MLRVCCYDDQFNGKVAATELEKYRRKGADKTTRLLVEALKTEGVDGMSLLDVGGGIGAVHHELLAAGAATAVHVDAAAPYIEAAAQESARRGHTGRVTFLRGDFVTLAPDLPSVDVVTLDRVICCYPDMEALVAGSASKAGRLYGAVFPRERWLMKLAFPLSASSGGCRGVRSRRTCIRPARSMQPFGGMG